MKTNKDIKYLIYIRKSKEVSNSSKSVSLVDQFNRIKSKLKNEYNYHLLDDVDSSIIYEIQSMKGRIGEEKEKLFKKLHNYGLFIENRSAFKTGKRDQFDAMVELSKKINFDGFVIWKASRLARNREDAYRILDFAFDKKERYTFICLDKEYSTTIEGKTQLEKDLIDAHKESMEKSRDGKFNYDTTYKVSNKIPNKLPYGYRRVYNEFNIYEIRVDEEAAKNIRKIFDYYITGVCIGYEKVAIKLNENGILKKTYHPINDENGIYKGLETRARDFNNKDIENIINNGLYGGYRIIKYNKLTKEEKKEFSLRYKNNNLDNNIVEIDYSNYLKNINGYYPLLLENKDMDWKIANKIFDDVQKIKDNKLTFRQKKSLSNKKELFFIYKTQNIRCIYCGKGITGEKKGKGRRDNYRCSSSKNNKNICIGNNKYIGERLIEKQFKENVLNKIPINNFSLLKKYIEIALNNLGIYKQNNENISLNKIKKIEKDIKILDERIENASIDENIDISLINTFKEIKHKKELEIKSLNNELLKNNKIDTNNTINIDYVIDKIKDISSNYDNLSTKKQKLIFSNFIDDIKFDGKNKTLDWKNVKFSHIVKVLTTNVQYFDKFFNRKPNTNCTGSNGTIKAPSNDDAGINLNGKDRRNCTYASRGRNPSTLLIKLGPFISM